MASNAAPIIIRKKKGGGHGGHHGGAWKVAYADFVTAMMAFFLLLWLLNSTTQEQRSGISDYFAPASASRTTSGSGGVLGGQTITLDGPKRGKGTPLGVPMPAADAVPAESDGDGRGPAAEGEKAAGKAPEATDEQDGAILRRREDRLFENVEEEIKKNLQTLPGLRKLESNLMIDRTEKGLRIQIVDRNRSSMFPSGSAVPYQHTRQLLEVIAYAVAKLPNKLTVEGHTDATPYARGAEYSNWELSSDRAHASRRSMIGFALDPGRFTEITGMAATEPLIADDPMDPRNRRIAITLLREARTPPPAGAPTRPEFRPAPPPPAVEDSRLRRIIPDRATTPPPQP